MPVVLAPYQRLPRYLTQDEVRRFFGAIADLRDLTLFAVVYHYGLRVSEVALLERADVDLVRSRIVVKRLKGGLWTERPLFASTEALLARFLAESRAGPEAPLFPGRDGALRKRQIQTLFATYRDKAGLPVHYTCHSLRHSIATHLLDAGASLEFVQDHLGHRSIRSTSIYARITDRHRAALFRELERSPWIVQPAGRPSPGLPSPVTHPSSGPTPVPGQGGARCIASSLVSSD
jgi:integrase